MTPDRRLTLVRERDFRRFLLGYTTSMLGSAMASVALTFAILESGGGGTVLGRVMAARILPLVLLLLVGGVISDRTGSRRSMLTADVVRCATQLGLVAVLLGGRPPQWALLGLVGLWGTAEALFTPALGALLPQLVRPDSLSDANALMETARSAASIAGPVLAGLLTAAVNASSVLALDAASYAVSVVVLLLLPRTEPHREPHTGPSTGGTSSFLGQLGDAWTEFRSHTWLWVTAVQGCLFNLVVWGPFLVLGPVVAEQRLGGATAWGLVMAMYGCGAVTGGLVMIGRRPRRPMLVSTVAALGWSLPSAALAGGCPPAWVCGAALAAGAGSAVCGTLFATSVQRRVRPGMLARVNACTSFGAFVLGPVGLAAAGPVSSLIGTSGVLGFGAMWQVAAVVAVLALPSVRAVFPPPPCPERQDSPPGRAQDPGERAPSAP
ncbi:MFS transporter [Peterkaempfera griseoplana]|uniref:MFS transporter n=1 Tax=Peterkaempfera griseoplana TaxID=66896 RepID=UPI00099E3A83|nr:MFS transporter [Peterkaempfera griseoplana]